MNCRRCQKLLKALESAKETIKTWHDMHVRSWNAGDNDSLWELYDKNSPEMKLINEAIAEAKGETP